MTREKYMKRQKGRAKNYGKRQRSYKRWQIDDSDFRCCHCKQIVSIHSMMGTMHRNHCPHCLWSKHVDTKPGNRQSDCHGSMQPLGFTLKHNGYDKYGNKRLDDIMIIHLCVKCGEFNINRIAADDNAYTIEALFKESLNLSQSIREKLASSNIFLIGEDEEILLKTSLFGKSDK